MTLDSVLSSLGAAERNLGEHACILIQQQASATHTPVTSPSPDHQQHAAAAPKGAGAAAALLQACWKRLTTTQKRRTRGVIVLSVEHTAEQWMAGDGVVQPLPVPSSFSSSSSSTPLPRLILDGCRRRYTIDEEDATQSSASRNGGDATPAPHSDTQVERLERHELYDMSALLSRIESTAKQMHQQYHAMERDRKATATPSSTTTSTAASADPADADESVDSERAFVCSSVSILIDDLSSLMVRAGATAVLAFLQALQRSKQKLLVIAGLDADVLAALPPMQVGSGRGNQQPMHAQLPIQSQLMQLASTFIAIRGVQPMPKVASTSTSTSTPSSSSPSFLMHIQLLHTRPSGKVTQVSESILLQPHRGSCTKPPASAVNAAHVAEREKSNDAESASSPTSLAQQFGSTFSLDLSSKAQTARAQTILPYQHTGQQLGAIDSLADEDDIIESDDDEDLDDPDDDLDV